MNGEIGRLMGNEEINGETGKLLGKLVRKWGKLMGKLGN